MKSKRTKALEISRETKEKVWKRQHGKSLFAPYKPITVEMCCCHYVSRAQGGLGEEWNIFGCFQAPWADEHKAFDRQLSEKQVKEMTNLSVEEMHTVVRNHFIRNYEDWSEEKCKYQKYKEFELKRREQ